MMSSNHLLSIRDLKTWFNTTQGTARAVDGVSFDIPAGKTFVLLGESGCGKSMTALSIMRLVPEPQGRIAGGEVMLDGQDLLRLPETRMRDVRGSRIAMIFQEPMTSLNPVIKVGKQIQETVERHLKFKGGKAKQRAIDLLKDVGIPDPIQRYHEYPHQLSGGMKQRVMIAIALAGEPDLLIADEPTTALDVTIQAQVLELLAKLQRDTGMAILMITHDLGVVAQVADHVAVMYAGEIVEQASRDQFFSQPRHPYSRKLFESLPDIEKRDHRLAVIRGSVPALSEAFQACRFQPRCDFAWHACSEQSPRWTSVADEAGVRCHLFDARYADSAPAHLPVRVAADLAPTQANSAASRGSELLGVDGLQVHFPIRKGVLKRKVGQVHAVDGVSMAISKGQTLALVGESGCGKTTTGKAILQLIRPTAGSIRFEGTELTTLRGESLRRRRGEFQIIFQDPFSSMNPRMMVGEIIEEGMIAQGIGRSQSERQARVDELLHQVGLAAEVKHRYPHEFSGGQRQRICIARALAVNPKLIVCDEPTSALDVSVQAQILNLLQRLQSELGLSYLFITHNLSVVAYFAHQVAVMYLGRVVEQGSVEEVLNHPFHPYTKALLSAVPTIEKDTQREVIRLEGDIPSPIHPPSGCHFHPRCPHATDLCRLRYPDEVKVGTTHITRCHLYE